MIEFSIKINLFLIIYSFITQQYNVKAACNVTTYTTWQDDPYDGILLNDKTFWRYSDTEINLPKSLALDLAYQKCVTKFSNLIIFQAGRHGPIDIQHAYDAMCSSTCQEIDKLVLEAMFTTQCSCLELSTQPGDFSYHIQGDLCLKNTGRLLCKYGFCGIWDCRLDDFMCPRYEFDKTNIEARGLGSCLASDATFSVSLLSRNISLLLCTLSFMYILVT